MKRRLPLLIALLFAPTPAVADTVQVAVAAHFAPTLRALAPAIRQATGHTLHVTPGSTGKLRAQIAQGAPFAVLLAADATTPAQLEATGHAVAGTRFPFAFGRLALWSHAPCLGPGSDLTLRASSGPFALANPRHAPYGAAAEAVLRKLGVWDSVRSEALLAENVAQAYQFVATHNARVGFVPWSFVRDEDARKVWLVPTDLHPPLRHDAVLLKPGLGQPGARALLQWLRSPEGRTALRFHGYDVPAP